VKVCVLATSFPRREKTDKACGNFIYTLTQALSDTIDYRIVAPHALGIKTHEHYGQTKIFRFKYIWPENFQTLAYGDKGIIENLKTNPICFLSIPFFLVSFFVMTLRVAKKCDLIHANWVITGAIGIFAGRLLKKPVVLTVHNTRLRHFPRWFSRYVINHVDLVLSPHPELTQIIRSFGKKELIEIPNMIDFSACSESSEADRITKEFQLEGHFVVTFVARLVGWKDPLTFIRAIPHVIKKIENIKFLFVGAGPLERDSRQLIQELGIEKHVIMTGGRNDVISILGQSDLFTALSTVENIWSMTVIEAMTSKVPCIITRAGSTETALKHLENAFLISPGDERELATAILSLYENSNLRKKITLNAVQLLKDKGFSKKQIIERTRNAYNQVALRNLNNGHP
jgi:L-malate glycosyltransferase